MVYVDLMLGKDCLTFHTRIEKLKDKILNIGLISFRTRGLHKLHKLAKSCIHQKCLKLYIFLKRCNLHKSCRLLKLLNLYISSYPFILVMRMLKLLTCNVMIQTTLG